MREEKFFEKRKKFFQKRKVYQKRKIEILLKMKGGIRKSKTEDLRKMRGEIQFFEKEKGHICTKKEKFLVKRLKN